MLTARLTLAAPTLLALLLALLALPALLKPHLFHRSLHCLKGVEMGHVEPQRRVARLVLSTRVRRWGDRKRIALLGRLTTARSLVEPHLLQGRLRAWMSGVGMTAHAA